MKWLRLYNEVYQDPKVQDLRPPLFKFWINFLCVASAQTVRGTVPSEAILARCLNLSKSSVARYCIELESLVLLHRNADGSLVPHRWEDRQRRGDDAAERKRLEREKSCDQMLAEASEEMSRDNVCTEEEEEREEEKTQMPPGSGSVVCVSQDRPIVESSSPPKPEKRKPPKVKLPDWIPFAEWQEFREMRAKIKKPLTPRAEQMAITELDGLREKGEDAATVLLQSVFHCWQSLYPVKVRDASDYSGSRTPKPPEPTPGYLLPMPSLAEKFGISPDRFAVPNSYQAGLDN
jgi:hypothetical protein